MNLILNQIQCNFVPTLQQKSSKSAHFVFCGIDSWIRIIKQPNLTFFCHPNITITADAYKALLDHLNIVQVKKNGLAISLELRIFSLPFMSAGLYEFWL